MLKRIFAVSLMASVVGLALFAEKVPPTSETFGGEERYAAHLGVDRPLARSGEKLHFRAVVLSAQDRTPLPENQHHDAAFKILGPKGETVHEGSGMIEDSVAGFQWDIPAEAAGGEYRAEVRSNSLGFAPAQRKFDVRAYRAPRFRTQIKFLRDGYGPGDSVTAHLEVTRAEGKDASGLEVLAVALVDGVEIHRSKAGVDGLGRSQVNFVLPLTLERGEGSLSFRISDGAANETAAKTIPILMPNLTLHFFPEGGDLIAGLEQRVYFEGRTPSDGPADIAGVVVDDKGQEVSRFISRHDGRGHFKMVAKKAATYKVKISQPAGINKIFDLPAVKAQGAIIESLQDVVAASDLLRFRIGATEPGSLKLVLRKKERVVAETRTMSLSMNDTPHIEELVLVPPTSVDGVLTVTLENDEGRPLCERLVYRQPARSLSIKVETDREIYTPGSNVTLNLKAMDSDGQPVAALIGLRVVDDSILQMIDRRDQAPELNAMVLLENDVRELADAHVYLDSANDLAPTALDLLLGVQGWRRYAIYTPAEFLERYGDAGRRALAQREKPREEFQPFAVAFGRGGALEKRMMRMEAVPMMAMAAAEIVVEDGVELDHVEEVAPNDVPPPAARPDMAEIKIREDDVFERPLGKDRIGEMLKAFKDESPVLVREFAHHRAPAADPRQRSDFTETLYWNVALKTDPKTGAASASFNLSDSITSFAVLADAFDASGALGVQRAEIRSLKPFHVDIKLPLEISTGDKVLMPLQLANNSFWSTDKLFLDIQGSELLKWTLPGDMALGSFERRRILLETEALMPGLGKLRVAAGDARFPESVERTLKIVPQGFPTEKADGARIDAGGAHNFEFEISDTLVPGSLKLKLVAQTSPLANLTGALERLIQEPFGCFEQTSSSTYPLVMAQQYFKTHSDVAPELIARSNEMLAKGYAKLTGFECKDKGYEWFGESPGHEALSAYGLMEFSEMSRVFDVDSAMIQRTRQWLLDARDGQGGFKRERRALHTWIEDADCSNAYITWALLHSGEPAAGLQPEIDKVIASGKKSSNAYVTALSALVAFAAGRAEEGRMLGARLAEKQTPAGYVDGSTTSIVGSSGDALHIETTSLALLAWMEAGSPLTAIDRSINWLAESCQSGRYGSTQSTVLALKAILRYDQGFATPRAPGSFRLVVDGAPLAQPIPFGPTTQGELDLAAFLPVLGPGKHTIMVQMENGVTMPVIFSAIYHDTLPNSSAECSTQLEVRLPKTVAEEGELVEILATMGNRSDKAVTNPIAIIGLPGGLEVRHDALKELKKSGRIASYEVIGREVVLYWRGLEAKQKVDLRLEAIAALPGSTTGPASRSYLYYGDEHKQWLPGMKIDITPAR